MAKPLPLYEKTIIKRPTQRALDITIFILLISLLAYRLLLMYNNGFSYLQTIAFLCEFWFSFVWFLAIVTRWNPVDYKTYPQRLLKREVEFPAVDIFVTTADPVLEPPIITVNTVLSLMALDYPANKLSCYVSDDGFSALTLYALNEALKFAKIWIPFCKKYEVQVRAPFMYFSTPPHLHSSTQLFQSDWETVKVEYEKLEGKIKEAEENRNIGSDEEIGIDLAAFSNLNTKNHPTIIKILWENKEASDELPHLIYVSREKSFKHHHHYKAGAMNVLARVSGVLTNAPYILNVDCDMFVNNPQVVLHAMCVFLNSKDDLEDIGYVQTPQCFYDGLKDDPLGNQLVVVFEYFARGIMGLQGPFYSGTGCFHRRKVLYGQFPHHTTRFVDGKASEQELIKTFGYSKTLAKSATYAFKDINTSGYLPKGLFNNKLEAANQVAGCGYEISTTWGSKIGWMYGSTSEDVLTGLVIQTRGWRSIFIALNPPAFLGCAPTQLVASLTQQKRWASGFLQVLFNKHCPIFGTIFGKLQWKQCAAYLWILTWGLRSIPELSYTLLPPYCLITNSSFFPTVKERAVIIPIFLFIIYNFQQLLQYKETSQSIRAWWNNQKMGRVNTICAWLSGVGDVVLKFLGERENVFEVTKKETCCEVNLGHFTFDESPMFVPGTTILLIQLVALCMSFIRLERPGSAVLEVVCSIWLVLCFWPFLKGIVMFSKGRYGLSFSIIYKSVALALLFVLLCQATPMN